ncbi:unnamed protein product [Lepeophtheirus salmonis]|uniref:(salmon louse) hypothetical protein n=1 Tax=Lepeophtheirus salmonis TaxID=72036 RepID=A0A7R8H2V0_LEPSM|nr:unnamed protein product [Lepeophtheirus salmonis]CAF2830190.1 unnamed protein product [Lepeophtheirus salmonis]
MEMLMKNLGKTHLSTIPSSGGGSNSNTVSSSPSSPLPNSPASPKDPLDDIQTLSLEEVNSTPDHKGSGKSSSLKSTSSSSSSKSRRSKSHSKKQKPSSGNKNLNSSSGDSIFQSRGASSDIIRSGHLEYNTMYASNDCGLTGPVTVNVVNAPNNSTMQCGCENINCPFCNLMLSIEKTDPTVLQ